MSREIKFRAWDAPSGVMQDWDSLVEHGSLYRLLAQPSSYPVMQWTGLQACNGIDIYEGDIIYLAGYGNYVAEFPFIELYEAATENDIGGIIGNIYQNKDLLK